MHLDRTLSLTGFGVRLVPLTDDHLDALVAAGSLATLQYFLRMPAEWSRPGLKAYLDSLFAADATRLPFAVADGPAGNIVGMTSFLDARPEHRGVEIGFTWYAPSARGTHINPACKFLLLQHAFEAWSCVRVQLKCDARNMHSRSAIAKLGAQFEGILRRHFILDDGNTRDTAMFSLIPQEWPAVRDRLLTRLAAAGRSPQDRV